MRALVGAWQSELWLLGHVRGLAEAPRPVGERFAAFRHLTRQWGSFSLRLASCFAFHQNSLSRTRRGLLMRGSTNNMKRYRFSNTISVKRCLWFSRRRKDRPPFSLPHSAFPAEGEKKQHCTSRPQSAFGGSVPHRGSSIASGWATTWLLDDELGPPPPFTPAPSPLARLPSSSCCPWLRHHFCHLPPGVVAPSGSRSSRRSSLH